MDHEAVFNGKTPRQDDMTEGREGMITRYLLSRTVGPACGGSCDIIQAAPNVAKR